MSAIDDIPAKDRDGEDDGTDTVPDEEPSDTEHHEDSGVPNPETGVGLGAGKTSTFEPEEDPDAASGDAAGS